MSFKAPGTEFKVSAGDYGNIYTLSSREADDYVSADNPHLVFVVGHSNDLAATRESRIEDVLELMGLGSGWPASDPYSAIVDYGRLEPQADTQTGEDANPGDGTILEWYRFDGRDGGYKEHAKSCTRLECVGHDTVEAAENHESDNTGQFAAGDRYLKLKSEGREVTFKSDRDYRADEEQGYMCNPKETWHSRTANRWRRETERAQTSKKGDTALKATVVVDRRGHIVDHWYKEDEFWPGSEKKTSRGRTNQRQMIIDKDAAKSKKETGYASSSGYRTSASDMNTKSGEMSVARSDRRGRPGRDNPKYHQDKHSAPVSTPTLQQKTSIGVILVRGTPDEEGNGGRKRWASYEESGQRTHSLGETNMFCRGWSNPTDLHNHAPQVNLTDQPGGAGCRPDEENRIEQVLIESLARGALDEAWQESDEGGAPEEPVTFYTSLLGDMASRLPHLENKLAYQLQTWDDQQGGGTYPPGYFDREEEKDVDDQMSRLSLQDGQQPVYQQQSRYSPNFNSTMVVSDSSQFGTPQTGRYSGSESSNSTRATSPDEGPAVIDKSRYHYENSSAETVFPIGNGALRLPLIP